MTEREKVIIGLEHHHNTECDYCPYYKNGCAHTMFDDAIALLKAQEPHVVTDDDFSAADDNGYIPAWGELMRGNGDVDETGWTTIQQAAIHRVPHVRYWTSCPTEAQREATPWNG